MVARERVVDVPKGKMIIKSEKSKRSKAIPASQSFEFGQQRVRISFQGKVIMSNSKETPSGCRKRRPVDEGEVVGTGRPEEKRQKMDSCVTKQCFALLEELMKHPVSGSSSNQTLQDPKSSDRFTITGNPMDLGIVKSNLANNTYVGIQDFEAAIRRAFYKAILNMNPPLSNVLKMTENLNGILQARWKSLGENWKHQENLQVGQGKVSSISSNSRGTCSKSEEKVVSVKLPLNSRVADEVGPPKPSKLARKNLRKGRLISNGRNGQAKGSISNANAKPSLSQGACKCTSCGSIKCQCSLPVDSNHASSRVVSSKRSLGGKIRLRNVADASSKLDCQARSTLTSEISKFDPDCDGVQRTTPASGAASDKELSKDPIFNVQISPKKALRAAMLKSRFADTILKAQQTMKQLAHGDMADQKKMQQEKLKTRLREEKAKVEAHIRTAESAAKMKREKEREAARMELQKMENAAGIELNLETERELEILSGCSLSCGVLYPLHQLGLFLKDKYLDYDLSLDYDDEDAVLHKDFEEGELLS